ncbi:elongation factor P--(R)-beta-lysine ligase [Paraglaciecola sp. 20A4]|uniref:elongation factor P--(R)-beta-lysine ligase n=1 Tax=Paraglaciecola sp. 20A4 TaxID=2687288 RepID=UPI0014097EC9|nr:elongation factor P--(R)-beta-lysine ligase [Paraglaciecola sp. 20A4]
MNNRSHLNWRPTADIQTLRQRAVIIADIRQFFALRNVLEVETPSLSNATVSDLHMRVFSTQFNDPMSPQQRTLYLQTSPEYAMKRLLCAGSGAIYQIAKAFRNEEAGKHHNPEFTMLEWYRPDFDHVQLMNELDELVQLIFGCEPSYRMTYQQAFKDYLSLDPLSTSLAELQKRGCTLGYEHICRDEQDKDTILQLLFSHEIEPKIGIQRPCFIYNFPASQAALARINLQDERVAERFELYYKGIELANGFHELANVHEQRQRFNADNDQRLAANLPPVTTDALFLAGLESGLPNCAGVAVGIDRLIMLALDKTKIAQVITFDYQNA